MSLFLSTREPGEYVAKSKSQAAKAYYDGKHKRPSDFQARRQLELAVTHQTGRSSAAEAGRAGCIGIVSSALDRSHEGDHDADEPISDSP
jgi:hypothetical protein